MRQTAVRLLLLAGSVTISLVLAELGLRAAGIAFPPFVQSDADRGWALRPGQQGWSRQEGSAYVRINRQGLRDREHAHLKPAATVRIAVLGDSYAEARQVPEEDAFWSVMARGLEHCPALEGRAVEAINFGVSGYGTAQELITLRRHVWPYSPDLVLLAFVPSNDVSDNSRALSGDAGRPYFTYQGDQLVLDASFAQSAGSRWRRSGAYCLYQWSLERSRVLQLVQEARNRMAQRRMAARLQGSPADGHEGGLANAVYRPPRDRDWADAWRVTEGLLAQMNQEVRAHGSAFMVTTVSRAIQVHPEPQARSRFMRLAGIDDLFAPEARVVETGRREGFAVVPLAPILRAHAESRSVFLHGFGPRLGTGHWNAAGHRLAGEVLARALCGCARAGGRIVPDESCVAVPGAPASPPARAPSSAR